MKQPERIGKYRVIRLLGSGGYGEVYLVRHPGLSVERAVKLLYRGDGRVSQEAVLQARLDHPGIVRVFDVEREGDRPYIVMEYLAGGSLAQRLERGGLSLEETLSVGAELARALEHAHGQGVTHRDLKPGNVLFSAEGRAKVADFGLARLVGRGEGQSRVAGTVAYLSPEQLQGRFSPASDLWALGCLLFQMLCGEPPFGRGDGYDVMKAIAEKPPPSLAERPEVPGGLAGLVRRLLDKDPAGRPSAGEAAVILESLPARDRSPVPPRSPTVLLGDWPCFRGGSGRKGWIGRGPRPPLEPLWEEDLGAPVHSSPAVCRGRVFLGCGDGSLVALDLLSGRSLWRFSGRAPLYPSPAAAGTALVAASGRGEVYALEAAAGEPIWRADLGRELVASPLLLPGRGVFVADGEGGVHHLAAADGAPLGHWPGRGDPAEASPLYAGGLLVWGDMGGLVRAVEPGREQPRWRLRLGGAVEASPAAWRGRLLLLEQGGRLHCLDLASGEALWRRDTGGLAVATPALDHGRAVLAGMDGAVRMLSLEDGRTLWRRELEAAVTASPCLGPEMALVADRDGILWVLAPEDGRVIQRVELDAPLHASPAVVQGLVIAATCSGRVTALGPGATAGVTGRARPSG